MTSRLPWRRPRRQLFLCALLDFVGFAVSAAVSAALLNRGSLLPQWPSVLLLGLIYLLFGWLFGSYTVLRWPGFRGRQVLQRILITGFATLVLMVLWGWIAHVPPDQTLHHRSVLLLTLGLQSGWALAGRVGFRLLSRLTTPVQWQLLEGSSADVHRIRQEWTRHDSSLPPPVRLAQRSGESASAPSSLGLDPVNDQYRLCRSRLNGATGGLGLLRTFQGRQPRTIRVTSAAQLAEQELERLPPALLTKEWLDYGDVPWSNPLSFQRQLKRFADVVVASALLLISAPLLLMAALLIWLEDRGPVFFMQERSGWMGQTFRLYKLRSMRLQSPDLPPQWTVPGDQRITAIGQWLRRTRIDELPQLINVLRGEMSLIGPRPERPEFEHELEDKIPHYRKRHWMLPGLSGWAQVSAPYAASVEEAELKLSYDLYYIRHFSTALDLLILVKTIKTVLKARGR